MATNESLRFGSVVTLLLIQISGYGQQLPNVTRLTSDNVAEVNTTEILVDLDTRGETASETNPEDARSVFPVDSTPPDGDPLRFVAPKSLTFRNPKKLSELDKAYLDAFTILSEESECSRLYGGPAAIVALNELVLQLRPTYFDRSTGLRMSGETMMRQDYRTGLSFRLFAKAEINLDGAFYRANSPHSPRVPSVGNFQPNTRETRVVLILHELGHLVRRADKQWVLPDDGHDPNRSRENTAQVVAACGKQIRSLGKMTFAEQLEKAETPQRAITTPNDPVP